MKKVRGGSASHRSYLKDFFVFVGDGPNGESVLRCNFPNCWEVYPSNSIRKHIALTHLKLHAVYHQKNYGQKKKKA